MAPKRAAPKTPPTTPPMIFLLVPDRPDEPPLLPSFVSPGVWDEPADSVEDDKMVVAWPLGRVLVVPPTITTLVEPGLEEVLLSGVDELGGVDDEGGAEGVGGVLDLEELDGGKEGVDGGVLLEGVFESAGVVDCEAGVELLGVDLPVPAAGPSAPCLLNKAPIPSCISGKYGEAEV